MPSRRQSSAMLSAPFKPSRTTLIFCSAEYCLRVARRMSLTTFSPGLPHVCRISVSSPILGGYDGPETLSYQTYQIDLIWPIGADVRHYAKRPDRRGIARGSPMSAQRPKCDRHDMTRYDRGRRQQFMQEQPHRLIVPDETGTSTRMTREYGRSLRDERLRGSAPFRRWGNQTLIAGLSWDGIVAPRVIFGGDFCMTV